MAFPPQDFDEYNPDLTLCSTLDVGQHVCCTAGDLPDFRPQPNPDGTCFSYYVVPHDDCSSLSAAHSLTNDEIESFNTETWGWEGCSNLQAHQNICLSTGVPPMPAPVANAVCGPQKPGTTQPGPGTELASLNPCPLNSCCVSVPHCPFVGFYLSLATTNYSSPLSCRTSMANAVSITTFAQFQSRLPEHLEQQRRARTAASPTVGRTLLLGHPPPNTSTSVTLKVTIWAVHA